MKTRMRLSIVALLAALALLAAACGGDGDALRVGSDIPFIPFEDFDENNNVVGFDADLIEEMASRIDREVEWIDTAFDTIFTQLATAAFDVVASATTITAERAQQVNFTIPYYKAQQALTVNTQTNPEIQSVEDLGEGNSVAVQTGTTGEIWAQENLTPAGVDVVSFPEVADTYIAAEGGQVDAVVFDEPNAVDEAARRPALEVVDTMDTNENYGFGVDPAQPELLTDLNEALRAMVADGTYQTIYDKWFVAPAGSVAAG